jgi:drug/metabolite transporter (DMT)-like permease
LSKTRALLERHPNTCGIALALVGSICFSGKAIVIKLAYVYPVDPSTLLAMRMLLSFPFFLAALIWSMLRTKQTVPISLKDYGLIVLAGLTGYYLASLFDFMGLQYITY